MVLTAVGYFQPITRAELSEIFGKEVSRDTIAGLRDAGDHDIRIIAGETGLARRIAELRPDVVLIDLANPSRDILEELALASGPMERPVAMFVDQSDEQLTRAAIEAGADVLAIPEAAWPAIMGAEVFICDALRYTPHPSHAHLALALEWIARSRARRGVLTNMHIDLDHDTVMAETPDHIVPAHDGMDIRL